MYHTYSIEQCILKMWFDRALNPRLGAKDIRGAVAVRYKTNDLFHQHSNSGACIYRYPLIQYKIIHGTAVIVGLGQGARDVALINLLNERLELGYETYFVKQQELSFGNKEIGIRRGKITYQFLMPWLALNENNSRDYHRMATPLQKRHLLERILTGNIISLSKGINYTVPSPVVVSLDSIQEIPTRLKNLLMLGFAGVFTVNFALPDYWGIGKSVSRGFGTIEKLS